MERKSDCAEKTLSPEESESLLREETVFNDLLVAQTYSPAFYRQE
jgi:hypothetical protein